MRVARWVKHDRLDDEVMVIDLESGAYFAFIGAAADAWSLLAAGHEPETVAAELVRRYDVGSDTVARDIETFVGQLIGQRLLEDEPGETPPPPADDVPPHRLPYERPAIERFDDLADLLLLDPVHEVEPTGWPQGRRN